MARKRILSALFFQFARARAILNMDIVSMFMLQRDILTALLSVGDESFEPLKETMFVAPEVEATE